MGKRRYPMPLDIAPQEAGYYRALACHVERFDAVTVGKLAHCADLFRRIECARASRADRERLADTLRWLGLEWLDQADPDALRRPEARQLRLRRIDRAAAA